MGYEDDLNLYAYVRNDPIGRNDPTGTVGGSDNVDDRIHAGMRGAAQEDPAGYLKMAVGANMAPLVVAGCVAGGCEGGAAALAAATLRGASISGAAGAAVEATNQLASGRGLDNLDTPAIGAAGLRAMTPGGASSLAARITGPLGALPSASSAGLANYAATRAQGGSREEALAGGIATAVVRTLIPDDNTANVAGQLARQFVRSFVGNEAKQDVDAVARRRIE